MLLDGVDVVQEVVDTATKLTAVNGSLATLEQLLADQLVNVYTSMYSQKSVLKKDYGDRIKAVTDNLVVEGGNVESLQVKMTTANGQISTLEGDVATLRTNMDTLNTNGNTHTAGLKATNVEVAALKALQTKDAATMANTPEGNVAVQAGRSPSRRGDQHRPSYAYVCCSSCPQRQVYLHDVAEWQ